jgi:late competence protein required for DNA uptake (superfamily II DNA/RNA helicase)
MARRKVVSLYRDRYRGDYLSDEQCDKLESIRDAYESGTYFRDLKKYLYDLPEDSVEYIKSTYTSEGLDDLPKGELTDSQTVMLAFGLISKCWLSGDSVGLGKTVLVAALYNYLKEHSTKEEPKLLFLVNDEDVMHQNCNQLIRFTASYFQESTGRKANAQKLIDFYQSNGYLPNVVGTHSLLRQPLFQELVSNYVRETGEDPFTVVVMDESAVLGNDKTQIYKQAVSMFSEVEYKVCLNATEFDVSLEEFYNQLNWLDPTLLPTKTQFRKDYFVLQWDPFLGYAAPTGKYKNAKDFKYKVGYRYIARTRKDLGAVMEDCTAQIVEVPINNYQKKLLRETSQPGMAMNCPWGIDKSAAISFDYCPKLKSLADVLDRELGYDVDENPDQVLIYAHHKEAQRGILQLMSNYSIAARVLNGDTPSDERKEIVEGFKNGDFPVLVTNVQKGLNFGNCDYIIYYEFPSVGEAVQFEGRLTRQENIVGKHVYVLLTKPREIKRFRTLLTDRARAVNAFAGTDYSMVLGLLLEGVNSIEV